MERHELMTSITALVAVPIVMLAIHPSLQLELTNGGGNTAYQSEYTYTDGSKENSYQIDFDNHMITAYLGEDPGGPWNTILKKGSARRNENNTDRIGIRQKVTPYQILKIKNAIDEYDGTGDPILPILEGKYYLADKHSS